MYAIRTYEGFSQIKNALYIVGHLIAHTDGSAKADTILEYLEGLTNALDSAYMKDGTFIPDTKGFGKLQM